MSEPRRLALRGLHHLTLICADLERTTAFYRDLLGMALVTQAANDDDPDARHFWFGAGSDEAGGLVSFLEYPAMDEGAVGRGSTHHFALAVDSAEELDGWRAYLGERGVPCSEILERGRFRSLYLRDPDGHIVEIATRAPGVS
jgi:catechol 2,3-dioxygenase-like lactoylglutathione lyase family enzyme